MKIYFVRHGQSMGNLTGDYATTIAGKLSENGLKQAEDLATRLQGYEFDHIFVSPIERVLNTIAPYLKRNGLTAEIWEELSEACWQRDGRDEEPGPWRWGNEIPLTDEEKLLFTFREGAPRRYPPGNETYAEGLRRVGVSVERLKEYSDGLNILVVGHGHAGSRLIELLLGITPPFDRFDHTNTGMSLIQRVADGSFRAIFTNRN